MRELGVDERRALSTRRKRGRRAISPDTTSNGNIGRFGGTEPSGFEPESRNIESLKNLVHRLELYERTRVIRQGKEEEYFVLALKKWLDGDDHAIDEWLSTL